MKADTKGVRLSVGHCEFKLADASPSTAPDASGGSSQGDVI